MDKKDAIHIQWNITQGDELMPLAATWLDLEITTLSEISQTEKGKYHMTLLICGIYLKQKQRNRKQSYGH